MLLLVLDGSGDVAATDPCQAGIANDSNVFPAARWWDLLYERGAILRDSKLLA